MTNKSTTLAEGITTQATTTIQETTSTQSKNNTQVQTVVTTTVHVGMDTTISTSNIATIATVALFILCLIAGVSIAVIIIVIRIKRRSKEKSGSSNKNSHNHSHLNYSNETPWAAGPNHFDTAIPLYEGIQLTPSTIQDEALPLGYDSVDTTTHNHVTPSTAITQQDNNRSQIKSERMYMYSAAHRPGKAKDEPLPPIPPYKVEDMYATHLEEPPPVPPQTTEMLYAAVRKKRKKSKDHNHD